MAVSRSLAAVLVAFTAGCLATTNPPPPGGATAASADPAAGGDPTGGATTDPAGGDRPAQCVAGGAALFAGNDLVEPLAAFSAGRHDLPDLEALGYANDGAYSLCVAPGCTLEAYEDAEFNGQVWTFTSDVGDLAEAGGTISGVVVTCS